VVPKLVRAVTHIKAANMSYYRQYFAVIAHNLEQHCGFGSALPPKNHTFPLRDNFTSSLGTTAVELWCRRRGCKRTPKIDSSKIPEYLGKSPKYPEKNLKIQAKMAPNVV